MTNTQTQEKIQQLQAIEQNMQHLLKQRQQFQMQLLEVESALEELKKTDKAYRIIGNIMVASEKSDLEKELTEKKDRIGIRVKSFEKQETLLKDQAKALREEIMKAMQAAK
ncbi:prefoldin subunit beta [Candidatus Woesearchaeota archaeon]|nr:prefoldin subunit beta [Candidatus Woesearchaeota archaeon]